MNYLTHHLHDRWHSGAAVSTVATARGFWVRTHLSVWSLHVLPVPAWVFSGYSGFLPQSKAGYIGDSKLPVGVNLSVNGWSVSIFRPWD